MPIHRSKSATLVLALLAGTACRSAPEYSPSTTYYSQFALMHDGHRYRTTNYRSGTLLPINSEVSFVSMNRKGFVVHVADEDEDLTVQNMPRHTGETPKQAFERMFAEHPIDVSRFTPAEQDAIARGVAEVGMSRDAVLAAIGYPPSHQTPSLQGKEWKYWRSTWDTFLVRFDDQGRVTGIVQ